MAIPGVRSRFIYAQADQLQQAEEIIAPDVSGYLIVVILFARISDVQEFFRQLEI